MVGFAGKGPRLFFYLAVFVRPDNTSVTESFSRVSPLNMHLLTQTPQRLRLKYKKMFFEFNNQKSMKFRRYKYFFLRWPTFYSRKQKYGWHTPKIIYAYQSWTKPQNRRPGPAHGLRGPARPSQFPARPTAKIQKTRPGPAHGPMGETRF